MNAIWRNRRRWSDNDRYWGPFTYAKAEGNYRPWAVELSSGCDEYPGNTLRFSGFGRSLLLALPRIIPPHRRKVYPRQAWDAATVARLGRDWYYDVHRREFGISLSQMGGVGSSWALHLHYGAQTHDSLTRKSKCYFLPWTEWRHVRHSLYDLDGNHFADMPESRTMLGTWEERKALEESCPSATFEFLDSDGEKIVVQTRIEEREWRKGEGWFKWLSWFSKPMISRSLDLRFSSEVGDRKGSWKGGTIGHSIEMTPGEKHASAFRRYCAQNRLTLAGEMGEGDIPAGVYWHADVAGSGDFFSRLTDTRLGPGFRDAWIDRKAEFPGKPVKQQHDETAAMVKRD